MPKVTMKKNRCRYIEKEMTKEFKYFTIKN